MSGEPTVDVVVSTFNEEGYVDRCLRHVVDQDYPSELVRILVVDGGSSDGTVAKLRGWAARCERLEVIATGDRLNLPEALNVAIPRGGGDLVAKVDAHGWPETDYLTRAVQAFAASGPGVACVGGRPLQEGETPFGEAVALARTSRAGVGASEYAGETERSDVDTVQCGVYRRDALEEVGGFDGEMNYGEDEELNWRLRQAGYRIVLDSRIRFHYVTRPTWTAAYRQYRNYGEARVRVVRKHPSFLRLHHLVPAGAVGGAAALCCLTPFSRSARRALVGLGTAYVGLLGFTGMTSGARGGVTTAPQVAAAALALHAGYGVGTWRGVRASLTEA